MAFPTERQAQKFEAVIENRQYMSPGKASKLARSLRALAARAKRYAERLEESRDQ